MGAIYESTGGFSLWKNLLVVDICLYLFVSNLYFNAKVTWVKTGWMAVSFDAKAQMREAFLAWLIFWENMPNWWQHEQK